MTDTALIVIAALGVTAVGLFAGWAGTKIYHAMEDARNKLRDDFFD